MNAGISHESSGILVMDAPLCLCVHIHGRINFVKDIPEHRIRIPDQAVFNARLYLTVQWVVSEVLCHHGHKS